MYEGRKEKNVYNTEKRWEENIIFPIKKQHKVIKKSGCTKDHSDSKSEEEAATMIQATYRGYKVRRKFDEVSEY